MSATTVPVTVTPEADRFLDEYGLRSAYERLLEHTLQIVPQLHALEVSFSPYHDESSEELIIFRATVAASNEAALKAEDAWMKWAIQQFPFEVTRRFILFAHHGAVDAR